jgi:ATP-dependent DNA helicase RecG
MLVMTATPIPRTLAMTLYGDLDVSVINQLPPGRKKIITMHYFDSSRDAVYGFMRKQIKMGSQVYVVYPLIRESEKMDYKALEEGLEIIESYFPPPQYAISVVHGKMPVKNKEVSMDLFKKNQTHIMVATTVIEVGVDIPNASVMVIESAERFGLSQLHQLRGRVGRGADQSYCILLSSQKISKEAAKRMEIMVNTNDGFEISEADLQLRGPGDIEGTQQSGMPFEMKIADLARDGAIIEYVRKIAAEIIDHDPNLETDRNRILMNQINRLFPADRSWSLIS